MDAAQMSDCFINYSLGSRAPRTQASIPSSWADSKETRHEGQRLRGPKMEALRSMSYCNRGGNRGLGGFSKLSKVRQLVISRFLASQRTWSLEHSVRGKLSALESPTPRPEVEPPCPGAPLLAEDIGWLKKESTDQACVCHMLHHPWTDPSFSLKACNRHASWRKLPRSARPPHRPTSHSPHGQNLQATVSDQKPSHHSLAFPPALHLWHCPALPNISAAQWRLVNV